MHSTCCPTFQAVCVTKLCVKVEIARLRGLLKYNVARERLNKGLGGGGRLDGLATEMAT